MPQKNYPRGYVVGVIRREHLQAVQQELQNAGFSEVIVHTSADDDLKSQLTANLNSFGDESVILQEHQKAWEEGGVTVGIYAADSEHKQKIREILKAHDGLQLMYFGALVVEEL
ncbi:hypothetical protein [Deinococcus roseus]|uniref:Uncharacterized protein n=1 Tax=Deinococcus roseus TaxID=392414 RepID=A0ABQ2CTS2_9DEIO|nr:hypothetical protein [Deinococcus roseus]GGJ19692.1 hypothetical protein GCM10008938_02250 [Deinococcus roseus]